jgi:hypothetical protein
VQPHFAILDPIKVGARAIFIDVAADILGDDDGGWQRRRIEIAQAES